MVFGRNYDWMTGSGMVIVNPYGIAKTSMIAKDGSPISWVSKYGSITFNQYGKEFPTGGMNEKGLVVELMWLDGTKYPAADQRPAVGVLQWIQYQLDNSATVAELVASDSKLRISASTPLHYLVADANGNSATIEFIDGKMTVHSGSGLPYAVLTNTRYDESISNYMSKASTQDNSLSRFKTACTMLSNAKAAPKTGSMVNYAFGILDEVAQGDFTKWSIVYDLKNKQINFRVNGSRQVKTVSFASFKFSCTNTARVFILDKEARGDVSGLFTDFTIDINREVTERSFSESSSQITTTPEGRKSVWEYPLGLACQALKSSR
jgi:choloylglycine hydrolase